MRHLFFGLFIPLLVAGIYPALAAASRPAPPAAAKIAFAGKVVKVHIEGGFCGLIADDGRRFDPVNLPADFCRDGLAVEVRGEPVTKSASVHMWGTLLRIDSIRRR